MLKWLSQGRGGAFASYSCVCLNFFQLSYMYTGPHLLHSSQFQQQIGRKAKDQLTSVREKEVTAEHLLQILAKSGQDRSFRDLGTQGKKWWCFPSFPFASYTQDLDWKKPATWKCHGHGPKTKQNEQTQHGKPTLSNQKNKERGSIAKLKTFK